MPIQAKATPYTIALADFDLEQHVTAAFGIANELARDRDGTISAADLLRAVLIASESGKASEAFSHLASLLPLQDLPAVPTADPNLELRLSPGLAESYPVARDFFSRAERVWGRDYVTFALLADGDPSLNEIANEAGTTADQLQDEWFEFVTSTDKHRGRDEWADWWRKAGVPLPAERTSAGGATYLFTWNPKEFPVAEIEPHVERVKADGSVLRKWSTGSRRHLSQGERVFLLRQGVEPRGLVGSGHIEGEIEQHPRWNWVVPVRWDTLSTEPFVTRADLIRETREEKLWNTQTGGVKLGPDLAAAVERLWSQATGQVDLAEAFRYAQTLSDLDHKNDWIGVRSDVEALSTLIAVNRVEPPLSIAIFGDWGSGKTFLMRRIQERVQVLEKVGATQEPETPTEDTPLRYCSSILQIEFNAWHYTESNLWASLVNHIFEKLHAKLAPADKGKEHEETVDEFFEQFGIARAAREEAEKRVQLIADEVALAEGAVEKEEGQVQTASGQLAKALGRSVWDYLDQELAKDGQETSNLKNALGHFGFEKALTSARTIYDTVERYRSVGGRAREVFGSLLATREGVYGAIAVAVVVLLATAIATVYKVPILSVGATLVGVLGWLAERAESARKPLEMIQSFDDWFSKLKLAEESRIATSLAQAQADLEQRREALTLARTQLAEAKARENRAEADLKQLTARDQMRRFVDERVTARTYAKHLGIISMIREDFEDLSDFMYRDRQPGEARLVQRVSEEVREAIPTVERIILYIDDLDRCRPERVVEVLEAIHLLLAFRLFVVVVAVDPRWVIESLRQRYPHLSKTRLSRGEDDDSESQNGPGATVNLEATAHDYLEKIFHIPFWVKSISPEACKSLVAGYFGFDESAAKSPEEVARREDERFHSLVREPSARASSIPDRPPIAKREEPDDDRTRARPEHSEETLARQEKELAAAERQIEDVDINDEERAFIEELAQYLGDSPRRIKRYANTYRLLKSGLTHQEARLFSGADGANDNYRVVLVFLAIVTGAPSLAPQIFAKALALRENFDIERLIKEAGLENESADPFEATNARKALELLRGLDITRPEIETWVSRVMRYAFRLTPVNLAAM